NRPDRREVLRAAAGLIIAGPLVRTRGADATLLAGGWVEGHAEVAKAGMEVLASGGNAVDACVTAALVASVVAPFHCGPGGYGGSLMVASPDGRTVAGIDFNSTAPAELGALTQPRSPERGSSIYGWKAVGVPGTLAGLQRVLDRFGTRKFAEVVAP